MVINLLNRVKMRNMKLIFSDLGDVSDGEVFIGELQFPERDVSVSISEVLVLIFLSPDPS